MPDSPLGLASPLLANFRAPSGDFRADGPWASRFRTHCLVGNVKTPNGAFEISRTPAGAGGVLRIRYERLRPGRSSVIEAELPCAAGPLGPESHEWALLDAVQRLPRRAFEPLRFSLRTYDGILLPDHTLAYGGVEDVNTTGGALRFHTYRHLGTGILPWVYYTTESGRLLIAHSGLQFWLHAEAQA